MAGQSHACYGLVDGVATARYRGNRVPLYLSRADSSLMDLGLADTADIDDLIAQLTPERAALRYGTTPMAVELIARRPA